MKIIVSNNQKGKALAICKTYGYFPKIVSSENKVPKAIPDRHAIFIEGVPDKQTLQAKLSDPNLLNRNWIIVCNFEVNKDDYSTGHNIVISLQ